MAEENDVMKEPQQITKEPQGKAERTTRRSLATATSNYKEPGES